MRGVNSRDVVHGAGGGSTAAARGRDLAALFDPQVVAVVGASDDPAKYGNWVGRQALRMRGDRQVYLVNRRGGSVLGEATYATLAELPEPVDLAVIAVPARGFEQVVTQALDAGARAIVAITAGLGEVGGEGSRREAAISARVRDAGALLLGPNCLGVLDNTSRLFLAANSFPTGRVGLISQSGNVARELARLLQPHGLGFSRFASLGNQADLTVADLIRGYAAHEGTDAIAVYCEDFRDGHAFITSAADAVAAGKPVVLLTVGGSDASRRGAASHTGALTTSSVVIDAVCRAAGVDRVASPSQMAQLLIMLDHYGQARAQRVAVLGDGGGHAAIACDVATAHGLDVPEFPPHVSAALRAELTSSASVSNPVDLAGAGLRDLHAFPRTLQLLLDATDIDAVLVTGNVAGYAEYGEASHTEEASTTRAMAGQIRASRKPVVVHTLSPDSPAADQLRHGGVPVLDSVDDAARALSLLARHRVLPPRGPAPFPAPEPAVTDTGYWTARALFAETGIAFPPAHQASTVEDAVAAANALGYPVAVKAVGPVHKSDVGGVALRLATADSVRAAVRDMQARLAPASVSVEAMVDTSAGIELIVGARRDHRFGPIVMVGVGGVLAELWQDVVFELAPVGEDSARDMLTALRAAPALRGARGRPAINAAAVAGAIGAVSTFAARHPEIAECEVNLLLATADACVGLDARIVLAALDENDHGGELTR